MLPRSQFFVCRNEFGEREWLRRVESEARDVGCGFELPSAAAIVDLLSNLKLRPDPQAEPRVEARSEVGLQLVDSVVTIRRPNVVALALDDDGNVLLDVRDVGREDRDVDALPAAT